MQLELVSHVNGDGDLLDSWFRYYLRLGVASFRLIVHGPVVIEVDDLANRRYARATSGAERG